MRRNVDKNSENSPQSTLELRKDAVIQKVIEHFSQFGVKISETIFSGVGSGEIYTTHDTFWNSPEALRHFLQRQEVHFGEHLTEQQWVEICAAAYYGLNEIMTEFAVAQMYGYDSTVRTKKLHSWYPLAWKIFHALFEQLDQRPGEVSLHTLDREKKLMFLLYQDFFRPVGTPCSPDLTAMLDEALSRNEEWLAPLSTYKNSINFESSSYLEGIIFAHLAHLGYTEGWDNILQQVSKTHIRKSMARKFLKLAFFNSLDSHFDGFFYLQSGKVENFADDHTARLPSRNYWIGIMINAVLVLAATKLPGDVPSIGATLLAVTRTLLSTGTHIEKVRKAKEDSSETDIHEVVHLLSTSVMDVEGNARRVKSGFQEYRVVSSSE